ncbi:putative histone-binding protein Caf1 [Trichinella patagoniensis]|uniref:Putative histone-binding protein Caf1 n=1 Tax=Trichinella patagoniensis TaxID=990121 RepID=A0A0V0ZK54_9BILA|nr:putative histone-binding protein Caf1 [Trichinella patagoniensis]
MSAISQEYDCTGELKMNENDQEIIEIGPDSSVDNFSDDQTVSSDEFKINEEDYLTWRKNALLLLFLRFLFFLKQKFICHELPDPSICVQWLPEMNDERTYRLLIGTILENEENAIYVLKIKLRDYPEYVSNEDELQFQTENEEMYAEMHSQVTILHKSQVNRIRYCPHRQFIIASQASDGNIYLFDYRNHPSKRGPFDKFEPLVIMEGQKQEGIGLAWNPHKEGVLLSSSRDCCIYEWNVISDKDHQTLNPTRIFSSHSAGVEDIDWHAFTSAVFCSVGCDGNLFIWDNRDSENSRPALSVCAHKQDVNCVSFNPFSEYLLATGSSDKTVAIWDLRNLKESLSILLDHTGEVNEVRWAPQSEFIIASCSEDCTANIYDMSHPTSLSGNNCSPELIFSHRGHRNPVQSLCWNANEPWLIASISNDAVLHLWKITVAIWDLRNLKESLSILLDHTGEVNEVRWAPQSEFIIASCSEDCTANIYDMRMKVSTIMTAANFSTNVCRKVK